MECLGKPVFKSYTQEELRQLTIQPPDEEYRKRVLENWDALAKPVDGMGSFETLTAQIGAIMRTTRPDIAKKAVVIMCADNGIVEEGVSQCGQEVTLAVARSMGRKQSSVGRMADRIGADTIPVDIGINSRENIEGVLDRKISCGTGNFSVGPAMTQKEAVAAIAVGIDMVYSCKEAGYKILATGEMGIGNTTTSSAMSAALLKCRPQTVTGRGAGLSDALLAGKQQVIARAVENYDLYHQDALTVLETVGGLDIAGLAGVCMGGALCHIPIVLDGVISMTAALTAERLLPGTREYLIASHKGREPAAGLLAEALGMEPVMDAGLALGEGTGAVMMLALLDMALSVYDAGHTFLDIQIEPYQRFGNHPQKGMKQC